MTPYQTLKTAFLALTDTQLKRFAWHLEHKTPVCCGDSWQMFTTEEGGA